MFHHIDNGNILPISKCVLSYGKFIGILDSGLQFTSIDEYSTFSKKSLNKCTITFDDGFKDLYTVAYPELKKRNIPFAIFIPVNLIDKDGYITSEELKIMGGDPLVTICSHGMTHDVLRGMKRTEQEYELIQSKNALQKITGKDIKYFAFSHGSYDEVTLRILKETSLYKNAFSVIRAPTNFFTRRWVYRLPRINCENDNMKFKIIRNDKGSTIKVD